MTVEESCFFFGNIHLLGCILFLYFNQYNVFYLMVTGYYPQRFSVSILEVCKSNENRWKFRCEVQSENLGRYFFYN